MSSPSLPSWNTTTDTEDTPVPVRTQSRKTSESHMVPVARMKKSGIGLPAIIGMTLALVSIGWSMGLGESLMGQLTNTDTTKTVTITAEGTFYPNTMQLKPGDEVTINTMNEDPQVLKSHNARELFTTQVLFADDEPFTFTVPDDAKGPYVYVSETLPEDQTLTFTVSLPIEAATENQATSVDSENSDPIPIPFDARATTSASSSSVLSAAPVVTVHASGPASISIGGTSSQSSVSSSVAVTTRSATIQTNPYTVHATGADQQRAVTSAVESASEKLHSGAPLAQYANYRPPTTSATGPTHTAGIILLVSIVFFVPIARRMIRM
ncbi:MAG: hypothetical protein ABL890_00265 [Candidatus Peribacteraceae bacterium]